MMSFLSRTSALKPMLRDWAAKFTDDETKQDRLVEQTIRCAPEAIARQANCDIEKLLFELMQMISSERTERVA